MTKKGLITIIICGILIFTMILIARLVAPGSPAAVDFMGGSARRIAAALEKKSGGLYRP